MYFSNWRLKGEGEGPSALFGNKASSHCALQGARDSAGSPGAAQPGLTRLGWGWGAACATCKEKWLLRPSPGGWSLSEQALTAAKFTLTEVKVLT